MVIGQIFLIALLQMVVSFLIDDIANEPLLRVVNIACYVGAMYIVLRFMVNYLLKELAGITHIFH